MNKQDAVRAYAQAGLFPILVHGLKRDAAGALVCSCTRDTCHSPGKHPTDRDWVNTPLDVETLCARLEAAPHLNIGLAMGRGVVAIDLDGPNGLGALTELVARYGALPDSLAARTGSGGTHLVFRVPLDVRVGNKVRLHAVQDGAVDVRGDGGQIVVAPSEHVSGGRYEWTDWREPAALPGPWLDALRVADVPATAALPVGVAALPEGAWPSVIAYLAQLCAPLGSRHEARKALAGFALRGRMPIEQAREFVFAVSQAAGHDDLDDVDAVIRDTTQALADGRPVSGSGWLRSRGADPSALATALCLRLPGLEGPLPAALVAELETALQGLSGRAALVPQTATDPIAFGEVHKFFKKLSKKPKATEKRIGELGISALSATVLDSAQWSELATSLAVQFPTCDATALSNLFAGLAENRDSWAASVRAEQGQIARVRAEQAETRGGVQLIESAKGGAKPIVANVLRVLEGHPTFRDALAHDVLADVATVRVPLPWRGLGQMHDHDFVEMSRWCQEIMSLDISAGLAREAIETYSRRATYHPVVEYLDSLTWDGTARLDTWLVRLLGVADSPHPRVVGAKALISACARAYEPGCKVDTMLVIGGKQGKFKSSVIKALCGAQWFKDTRFDLSNKDSYSALRNCWIYELQEMSSFQGKAVELIKNFLSSAVDSYRPPYGHLVKDFPRRSVMIGTTNQIDYLQDDTGARRFWCVWATGGNPSAVAEERDALWAEAVSRYKAGEPWYLDPDEAAQAEAVASVFSGPCDPWIDSCREWLRKLSSDVTGAGITTRQFLQMLGQPDVQSQPREAQRAARALRACGLVQGLDVPGTERRYYVS